MFVKPAKALVYYIIGCLSTDDVEEGDDASTGMSDAEDIYDSDLSDLE